MTDPLPYQGRHLVADLHGCVRLDDAAHVEACLIAAAEAAKATVLEVRLHHFGPGMGVTGVALLAESHISIHSWPEHGYAAIDIFLCGRGHDLEAALSAIARALEAKRVERKVIERGYGAALAV